MKIGYEVEGRFKGVLTLFCTAEEYLQRLNNGQAISELRELGYNFVQLYISDLNNTLNLDKLGLNSVQGLLSQYAQDCIISVERTALTRPAPNGVHVCLSMSTPSFQFLKTTDQVKFYKGPPGSSFVYSVCKENMSTTVPADYHDIEVSNVQEAT